MRTPSAARGPVRLLPTIWLPLVTVDMRLGEKASPAKSTSGFRAAKLLTSVVKRAAPGDEPLGSML